MVIELRCSAELVEQDDPIQRQKEFKFNPGAIHLPCANGRRYNFILVQLIYNSRATHVPVG